SDLEALEVEAIIPPQREGGRKENPRMPLRRFKYDARHGVVTCPQGKRLVRSGRNKAHGGWRYKARAADCAGCPLRERCVPPSSRSRVVMITHGYESLLRARRRRSAWTGREKELYARHRWRAEGAHAEAKTRHGLKRAARRGLDNVAIQAYLTAVAMNLKRLAALLRVIFRAIGGHLRPTTARKSPSAGGIAKIPFSIPIRSEAA
ncbi:MAG TPA: transposase, partial [Candidatus Brocadiia bacterium]|nr:transposase [Candidatus Brocadiia bacterium]